ncbi:MAG: hypothetical protein P1U47_04330 [Zhongshania sp.]|uniref:hypothetical protein n=1 Tax=Zhongshania sp. TaxID=1971902 RepID=UPI0026087F19|nr:hypothetical protein [Zhongshania sp.]MDF1691575.1 hypothetical protein [Zhongshania sp.]
MSIRTDYREELACKLTQFFSDQQQGLDIPPAQLYRLEGYIEAGILVGFITEPEIKQNLIDHAKQYLNSDVAEFYRQDYRLILHLRMATAPVYPGNKSP